MYLLDTNALLYFLYDSEKLSAKASEVIYHSNEKISVSIVSMWEIAIKSSIGKLKIRSSISKIAETCEKEQFDILSIKPFHLDEIGRLPMIHGDPFDRLIISQAIAENMVIITKDRTIPLYHVDILWQPKNKQKCERTECERDHCRLSCSGSGFGILLGKD